MQQKKENYVYSFKMQGKGLPDSILEASLKNGVSETVIKKFFEVLEGEK